MLFSHLFVWEIFGGKFSWIFYLNLIGFLLTGRNNCISGGIQSLTVLDCGQTILGSIFSGFFLPFMCLCFCVSNFNPFVKPFLL